MELVLAQPKTTDKALWKQAREKADGKLDYKIFYLINEESAARAVLAILGAPRSPNGHRTDFFIVIQTEVLK